MICTSIHKLKQYDHPTSLVPPSQLPFFQSITKYNTMVISPSFSSILEFVLCMQSTCRMAQKDRHVPVPSSFKQSSALGSDVRRQKTMVPLLSCHVDVFASDVCRERNRRFIFADGRLQDLNCPFTDFRATSSLPPNLLRFSPSFCLLSFQMTFSVQMKPQLF